MTYYVNYYNMTEKKMRTILRTFTKKTSEKNPQGALKYCIYNEKLWHPVGDSNPCCRRERAVKKRNDG